jgi:gamma-glutamyltranspeptidase/glutathione hydrolase
VIPGTGVVMNNEMDDFSIAPGTPNAFGLVGAEANAIAPGKRPLSSMSPTIVIGPDGNPRLTCGAAGGPRIINAVLQVVLRTLDAGEPIDAAIAAPRVHHQWEPDRLVMERGFERRQIEALRDLGHDIGEPSDVAIAQGIECGEGGELIAAADPRTEGAAAAT